MTVGPRANKRTRGSLSASPSLSTARKHKKVTVKCVDTSSGETSSGESVPATSHEDNSVQSESETAERQPTPAPVIVRIEKAPSPSPTPAPTVSAPPTLSETPVTVSVITFEPAPAPAAVPMSMAAPVRVLTPAPSPAPAVAPTVTAAPEPEPEPARALVEVLLSKSQSSASEHKGKASATTELSALLDVYSRTEDVFKAFVGAHQFALERLKDETARLGNALEAEKEDHVQTKAALQSAQAVAGNFDAHKVELAALVGEKDELAQKVAADQARFQSDVKRMNDTHKRALADHAENEARMTSDLQTVHGLLDAARKTAEEEKARADQAEEDAKEAKDKVRSIASLCSGATP